MTHHKDKQMAPANTQKFIQELTGFSKQLYSVRTDITTKLSQSDTDESEYLTHLESLLQKITQLQKNASHSVQESSVKIQQLQCKLLLIEKELSSDVSTWTYWKSECPICLRKIRIDPDPNTNQYQTVPCCHNLFHSSCLNTHYKSTTSNNKSCPLCRKPDIDWHPFYEFGTGITPDKFKHTFETMTHETFLNNFDHLGNNKFREAFQQWSTYKTKSIKDF